MRYAFLPNSAHRQGEVQDLEGVLGLVLREDGVFADGAAEMSDRLVGASALVAAPKPGLWQGERLSVCPRSILRAF